MNILFMSRLYWPHVGGVEKHVEKVCKCGHLENRHLVRLNMIICFGSGGLICDCIGFVPKEQSSEGDEK